MMCAYDVCISYVKFVSIRRTNDTNRITLYILQGSSPLVMIELNGGYLLCFASSPSANDVLRNASPRTVAVVIVTRLSAALSKVILRIKLFILLACGSLFYIKHHIISTIKELVDG